VKVYDSAVAIGIGVLAALLLHPTAVAVAVGIVIPLFYWLGLLVGRRTH
jgi:hypothetical protein